MNYSEAINIIKVQLEKKHLKTKKQNGRIEIKNIYLDINTNCKWNSEYAVSNICLKTIDYDINYNHKHKRIIHFDIINGNYDKLVIKIKQLQKENVKIKKDNREKKEIKEENYQKVKEIFEGYKITEIYKRIEIETPYFEIIIYPNSVNNIRIISNADLDYIKVIELLTKLGMKKENK